jgi:C-terminal processing protease CtpA/Prc
MKKIIFTLVVSLTLIGCGSDDTQPNNASIEPPNKVGTTSPLPSSPQSKPEISFDDELLLDIEHFVKLAHAIQYFYPSETSQRSNWPLFIAESIVELSQTPPVERADKGIFLLRQIAPYLVRNRDQLPAVNDNMKVSTWLQNAPFSQSVYMRSLLTQSYADLQNRDYTSIARVAELDYFQESIYFPLYLPENIELQGQIFQQPGRWQLSEEFEHAEICMASVSSMWAAINHFWPYFDQVSVDWQSSLPNLLEACTKGDFVEKRAKIYSEFTKLKDNHIMIAMPTPEQYKEDKYIPFLYELVENKAIVVRAEQNQQTGVEIGDEILKINDQDIHGYLEDKADTSLKNDLQRKVVPAFTDVFKTSLESIEYQVKKPDGQILRIQVTPKPIEALTTFHGLRYVPRRDEKIEKLSEDFYRLNVYNISINDTSDLFAQLQDAKGVVLDMRNYPTDWHGWQTVLSWFIERTATNDTISFSWQGAPNQTDSKRQQLSQSIQPAENKLNIPVVALSSRYSQSSNEHSLIFARSGGIPILGEPTSGINGNIIEMDLFGGSNRNSAQGVTFIYTNMKANRLNGDALINAGIEPDILVPRTIQSHREQVDNQLTAAIEYLQQQIDK